MSYVAVPMSGAPQNGVRSDTQVRTVDLVLKCKKLRLREVGQWWRRALTWACRLPGWAFPMWVGLWAGPFPTSSFWSEILLLTPVAV